MTGPNEFSPFPDGSGVTASLEFTAPESGEYAFAITPTDPNALGTYRVVITVTGN